MSGNDQGPRHRVGTPILRTSSTGVYGFQAIATTLFARADRRHWTLDRRQSLSVDGSVARPQGSPSMCWEGGAPARAQRTSRFLSDQRWLDDGHAGQRGRTNKRLCAVIDREDLAADPRFCGFRRAGPTMPMR